MLATLRSAALVIALIAWTHPNVAAQATGEPGPWTFTTRLLAAGTNRTSEPTGYKVYSTFPLEIALRRALHPVVSLELAVRSESREVDREQAPTALRLGSIEFLPVNLLLQVSRGGHHTFRPYAGLGGNLTVAWEKSGTLDSMDVSPSVGPAIQVGTDLSLTRQLNLNFNFRWNTHSTDIESHGVRLARLMIDAASLGVGFGVRF
jgi:outer membrane protein W